MNDKKIIKKFSTLLFTVFALSPPTLLLAATAPLAPDDINALELETKGKAKVKINNSHGAARFVSMKPNEKGGLTISKGADPKATLDSFLTKHGKMFGLISLSNELKLVKTQKDDLGSTQIVYTQVYKGLPVYGSGLIGNINKNGDLRSVNGRFIPKLSMGTKPTLAAADANAIAVKEILAEPTVDDGPSPAANIPIKSNKLVIFNPSIAEDKPGISRLAYMVKLGNGPMAKMIFVDAMNGVVLGKRTVNPTALNRQVYDAQQLDISSFDLPKSYPHKPFWVEGNAFPTGQPFALPAPSWKSTNDVLAATKGIYDLYKNTFNISSPDNLDTRMDVILNYTVGNAFAAIDTYPDVYTGFGLDLATDDVVGHEWQHWYTNFSGGGLDYSQQAGALHESYSDIFGEVIDFLNFGQPFGGGDLPNTLRTDGTCALISKDAPSARSSSLEINSPPSIAQVVTELGLAQFGVPVPLTPLTGDVVHVDDGSTAVILAGQEAFATIHDGCQVPFVSNVNGKIALIKRGNCNFTVKAINAQSQGAAGVIIYNRDDEVITMGGSTSASLTIPVVMIKLSLGESIVDTLATSAVNVTLSAEQAPRYTDNTVRWLHGEDEGVYPGNIPIGGNRDLWDPTCLHYPGKVSDSFYACGAGDNGGVHINSGVPNHAFALLVDGGNFNGYTITGLGLTKAAHIYHRAQADFQFNSMTFADHADALEQACGDLVGQPLKGLGVATISGDVISAADCDEVAKTMLAVEMRTPPGDFHPDCNLPMAGFATYAPVEIVEGDSGTKDMVFTVILSALSDKPVSMDYEAQAFPTEQTFLSARKGEDFNPTKGTLVIPPGSQTATIVVPIKGDKEREGKEMFGLLLTNPVNVVLTGSAYGVIIDND